jgi:hypothetical protein
MENSLFCGFPLPERVSRFNSLGLGTAKVAGDWTSFPTPSYEVKMSRILLLFLLWTPPWSSMADNSCVEIFEEGASGPIFSPEAIRQLREMGLQDEILPIQQSHTGLIIQPSRETGNFSNEWTLFVSHGFDSGRFQDLCFVAFVSKNENGELVVDRIQFAEPENENFFWRRLAKLHDVSRLRVRISLDKSKGQFKGRIMIPPEVSTKMQFKHAINFTPGFLNHYSIERIYEGREADNYDRYLLESKNPIEPVNAVSSPFEMLAHLGSGIVVADERKLSQRRRLIMILKRSSEGEYIMISLYENPYN